ncbi:(S)-ureidoglycine aminohydrolase [Methylobacterium sp. UNC300MFChir4.1]|uniref:bifunctional allantoicase/(S)-ureidoglycine aminohydrolase n=1 Tax=Methylobacterium sp. UNC300MFChir4.1 TaxID=1502747 RepID=UPI0008CC1BCA|nr:bifunctional allantoicase/(S)-ureidoglycine aminohydrolase [Methylobacterium sp. UNC300MFChir4.1]SEP39861.1 (S)-ureidoglycine aminohydrolase [Methylobacterium sp. UNC300MFChir4.1]
MSAGAYNPPCGGLPGQTRLMTGRAVFTEAYAVIPHGVMSDIVTSLLPGWDRTQAWIVARPLSGFAETFAQYLMEVAPGGGSQAPEPDSQAQGVLFVVAGTASLTLEGARHALRPGSYAYLAPGAAWALRNDGDAPVRFHWIRKAYQPAASLDAPTSFVTHESAVEPAGMVGTDGAWATTRFVASDDLRHDMHVNIVSMRPGASIPFEETHVMEHGLFVLEGKAVYRLNRDWVEVEAGDFMWLRAFCPQACYAGGPGPFRYLLYKDVNRHPALAPRGLGR